MYYTRRDLLNEKGDPISSIWNLPEAKKLLKKQQSDGSWKSSSQKQLVNSGVKYPLVETWKQFRYLIEQFEFTKEHPAIEKAAEFLFSCQTQEGDIRGFLANQYAPYYTGAITALLIKAGYVKDSRIEKSMKWLLDMRQDDGGWVIGSPGMIGSPHLSTKEVNDLTSNKNRETLKLFDKSKPFSAAGTGMIIRAFAAHPVYRSSEPAIKAANLLKSKFFKKDNWSSYQHPDNWIRFQFPFWWNNILTSLDSISWIGIPKEDEDVQNALSWFVKNQEPNGLWKVSYSKIHKNAEIARTHDAQLWISLMICRIFKKFFG